MGRKDSWTKRRQTNERRTSKAESNYMLQYRYEQQSHIIESRHVDTSSHIERPISDIDEKWERCQNDTKPSKTTSTVMAKNTAKSCDMTQSSFHKRHIKKGVPLLSSLCLEVISNNMNDKNSIEIFDILSQLPSNYISQLSLNFSLQHHKISSNILKQFYSSISGQTRLYLGSFMNDQSFISLCGDNGYGKNNHQKNGTKSTTTSSTSSSSCCCNTECQSKLLICNSKTINTIPDSWEDYNISNILSLTITARMNDFCTNLLELHLYKTKLSLNIVMNCMGYQLINLKKLYLHNVTFNQVNPVNTPVKDIDDLGCSILTAFISFTDTQKSVIPAVSINNLNSSSNNQSTSSYFQNLNYVELNHCSWCTVKALTYFSSALHDERDSLIGNSNHHSNCKNNNDIFSRDNNTILPQLSHMVIIGLLKKMSFHNLSSPFVHNFGNTSTTTDIVDIVDIKSLKLTFRSTCDIELSIISHNS